MQIDIDDPADGNPWDGVGTTAVKVFVNGSQITNPNDDSPYTYERLNGGFTDNYVTLYGLRQTFTGVSALATHQFDNFTVWSAPLFPMDIDADFNDDGAVDGADLLIWQRGNGLTDQADKSTGDSNGDGNVDAADLANWQGAYGSSTSASAAGIPVPEPSALRLWAALVGCAGVLGGMARLRGTTLSVAFPLK
ncbi:MAG: hypothetical protein CMJ58_07850 [Planctomycetaceae bacterium]|nr:hypothetical protein [Planctomycetaceae bacterium]